jgi:hypothetical protein
MKIILMESGFITCDTHKLETNKKKKKKKQINVCGSQTVDVRLTSFHYFNVEVVDVIAASFHYISTIQVRAGP